jgi:transcriptional regulator with XRE-family HTH domain
MADISEKLGKRLQELRKDSSLSQERLSLKADLDRSYVSKIERAECYPSIKTLEKIAQVLEVPVMELFRFEELQE